MTTDRQEVLKIIPQARYLNLSDKRQCHCIDDDYNDRYLSYAQPTRRAAWAAALRALRNVASPRRTPLQMNKETA